MTAPSLALADTTTMLRRDIRHAVRFPMVTISGLLVPVLFLLLFDGVFGHTLRAGLGSAVSGGYINYVLPGILVIAAASVAESTALGVNADMGEGIIARFRTMAIWRPQAATGQQRAATPRRPSSAPPAGRVLASVQPLIASSAWPVAAGGAA